MTPSETAQPPPLGDPVAMGRLFELGDFHGARREAHLLLGGTPEERAQAADVLSRLRPDPAALFILVGCAVLFVLIVWLTLR